MQSPKKNEINTDNLEGFAQTSCPSADLPSSGTLLSLPRPIVMDRAESRYRRMQALLFLSLQERMAELILFDSDIQHFHSIQDI